jgi:hypothetical protein
MVRKVFCISDTFIHVTISLLIFDQKKHDEYENRINALRSHNVIIFGNKDTARIRNFKWFGRNKCYFYSN